ncbi:MAG: TIGR03000 domain-containing protein [Pirellulales bacterium]
MMRSALKIGAIAVVLFLAAQEANAFGHRHGGWCGAGGCGGGGCGYGGWYGGYGGYGWGYGGWYGGYNGYGWGYGGYRTSLGYLANIAAPTTSARVASTANNSATLTVSVPADARIFVNDQATKTTGASRSYVSRNLQPGARYTYRVRAEFTRDGRQVSEVKTVQLSAGQNQSLAFGSGPQAPTASATAALR